jgi:hypothetical protein
MLTLVARSLRRIGGLLAALFGLVAVFQLVLIAVASSYADASTFERLAQLTPAFMQQAFGPALMSFGGMAMLGYFHPVAVMVVVQCAIYLATEPAADVEFGLVDLVLAKPLPRHQIVTRSLLVMTIGAAGLPVAMGLGTWLGLSTLAPAGAAWPAPRLVLTLMIHLIAVAWCFGAIALAMAAWARRRGAAQGPVALAAVALYLLDLVGASWRAAEPYARLSPFHYYQGTAILTGRADSVLDLSVLGSIAVVAIAVAYWQFRRRDL